ncbi:hypothetical protein AAFF_G00286370 [Aldrovandia affinis]|uniref:Uncharacterized protein n=1 Tax=Aldrovandia affinis TaxID=143900 RepID=A0AAD7TAK3_9TELE|nr:hypothetical protein AAFF_G00286370 [Aldrovandia affinis]
MRPASLPLYLLPAPGRAAEEGDGFDSLSRHGRLDKVLLPAGPLRWRSSRENGDDSFHLGGSQAGPAEDTCYDEDYESSGTAEQSCCSSVTCVC